MMYALARAPQLRTISLIASPYAFFFFLLFPFLVIGFFLVLPVLNAITTLK
jgi:hypothetical protein